MVTGRIAEVLAKGEKQKEYVRTWMEGWLGRGGEGDEKSRGKGGLDYSV